MTEDAGFLIILLFIFCLKGYINKVNIYIDDENK